MRIDSALKKKSSPIYLGPNNLDTFFLVFSAYCHVDSVALFMTSLVIDQQFHAHPVHQKVSRLFGPRYIGDDFFFRVESILIPYPEFDGTFLINIHHI
jgi:hypothetical protein